MNQTPTALGQRMSTTSFTGLFWHGADSNLATTPDALREALISLEKPLWVIQKENTICLSDTGHATGEISGHLLCGLIPAVPFTSLGDPQFKADYGVKAAYYAGAMAGAIASENLVIALGKAGFLGSFGAGGCSPARVEAALKTIQAALPEGPYAFNLLNSPNDPRLESGAVELYVRYNVPVIEASAYLDMTYALVYYRLTGLSQGADGSTQIGHRIIAKISRKEVARRFLSPAPDDLVQQLLKEGKITALQAELSKTVPMADDITVEADSGGHTDNRPLVSLLPTMLALRDELQATHGYAKPVRIGAGGGISTPESALAAFMMGAAYVVTGSANQACVEAGSSEHTRNLLAQADMADVAMAPAADMFEMGVRVQVLKRGTMFAPRASKLYEIYSRYPTWQEVPQNERDRLETTVFKRKYEDIWKDTVAFFTERDPSQIERANRDPHQQMALVFRWYLGLSSRWSNTGEKGREMDYQIWCGPSMGSFNDWVRGSYMEQPANRHVLDVAYHILTGAAFLTRVRLFNLLGGTLPADTARYLPAEPISA